MNEKCIGNVKEFGQNIKAEHLISIFNQMEIEAKDQDLPAITLITSLYGPGEVEPGDFAPEIYFVLRKVEEDVNESV